MKLTLLFPVLLPAFLPSSALRRFPFPGVPPVGVTDDPAEEQWYQQALDHFNVRDPRQWRQRYWVSWEHFRQDGPVFLLIGGEGAESPGWLKAGALHDYALQYSGAMFILEHRYYGESKPVSDLSVKNLTWLSSHQALADLAAFIVSMKEKHSLSGPWVAIGGSYPGSLAGWLRLKYPHLVAGAVAVSGPVNAKPDFPEYLRVVDTALRSEGEQCSLSVRRAVSQVISLTSHSLGQHKLGKMFRLCQPLEGSQAGVATLVEGLLGHLETVVQYNRDKKTGPWSNLTTTSLCQIMTAGPGSPLERFAQLNDLSLKVAESQCLDVDYSNKVRMLRRTDYTDPISRVPGDTGNRQWLYQTCTQFGWYQSSDQPDHAFGEVFPLDFFVQMCSDVFGAKFDLELLKKGISLTTREYGGLKMSVTKVVFVHGSLDPWHALGITQDLSASAPAILIEGTAHCANLYPPAHDDPQQLKDARLAIGKLIGLWIAEANTTNYGDF